MRELITGTNRVNVRDFGAVGNGSTDDTAAIEAAWSVVIKKATGFRYATGNAYSLKGPALYFPAGNYVYDGTGLDNDTDSVIFDTSFRIFGDGSVNTRITLGATGSFVACQRNPNQFAIEDLQIHGGDYPILFSDTSSKISGKQIVRRVLFKDYTGCALGRLSVDWPYILVDDCVFDGITDTSIGIAFPGDVARCMIWRNTFLRNKYHIKLGNGGGSASIVGNDFLRFDAVHAGGSHDIWFVPVASVVGGTTVIDNKFGPELRLAGDHPILFADEDTGTGTNFTNHPHLATTSVSPGVQGNDISHNTFGWNSGQAGPMIYSTVDSIRALRVRDNRISGTAPTYLLEFLNPTAGDHVTTANMIEAPVSDTVGISQGPVPISNRHGIGPRLDRAGQYSPEGQPKHLPGAGADVAYQNLLATTAWTNSGAHTLTTGQADAAGGTDATKVDSSGTGVIYIDTSSATVGLPLFFEVDLKGTGTATNWVSIAIKSSANVTQEIRRVPVLTGWYTHRFLMVPRSTAARRLVLTFSGDNGSVLVGRPRVYHAYEPVNTGPIHLGASTARIYTGTGSPEGARTATVGSLYVQTDGGAATTLYVKESGTGNTGWVAK